MKTIYICPKCGYQIFHNRKLHTEKCDGQGPKRIKEARQAKLGSEQHRLNLSNAGKLNWQNKDFREKISCVMKGNSGKASTPEKEENRKRNISNSNKGKTGGLRKGSGRGKKGWYMGYWCDSSWELAFVIYNLEHGIEFKRNLEGFEYEYEGKIHRYYPDFIIEEMYYEIKGYNSEQNRVKHFTFTKPLTVLKKVVHRKIR